ncbi:MAG: T9SS type A sorting domain-containing protein [Flavobacteriales bacterium]|nr:T9SS type A sorting domain-containing protein [Flavobacteriales bacterium]
MKLSLFTLAIFVLSINSIFAQAPTCSITTDSDVSCTDGCDGVATVSISGNDADYSIVWSTGKTANGIGEGGTDTETSLCAGTYLVIVTDNSLLTGSCEVTLDNPTPLTGSVTTTDMTCNGLCNGTATFEFMGGEEGSPASYQWNDPMNQVGVTASFLCAGSYTVTVTTDQGCIREFNGVITEPAPVTALINYARQPLCFNEASGEACVFAQGGTAVAGFYTYAWNNGGSESCIDNVIGSNIVPLTVTVTDDNGCTASINTLIYNPTFLNVLTSGVDPSCNSNNWGGVCDGSVTAIAVGGTGSLYYQWDMNTVFQSTATAVELCGGEYCVTVTDANLCMVTACQTITEPSELIVADTTFVSSTCGNSNGSITITPAGGNGPIYSVLWNDGQTGYTLSNVSAGMYCVTIVDANNCEINECYNISDILGPQLNGTSGTDITCYGAADGTLYAEIPTGGTMPYIYKWTSPDTVYDLRSVVGVVPGSYVFCVTDANECRTCANSSITILAAQPINALLTTTDILCYGDCDGTASTQIVGGVEPYDIRWNASQETFGVSSIVLTTKSDLCANNYAVTITDANGCNTVLYDEITEPAEPLSISATVISVSCNGSDDGSIVVPHTGGTGIPIYTWSSSHSDFSINGLSPGIYDLTVTDANICTVTGTYEIYEADELILELMSTQTHCDMDDGSITSSVTGGVPDYAYLWSHDNITTSFADDLATGCYYVTVTDAAGCTATQEECVLEVAPLEVTLISKVNPSCYGICDGSIEVELSGGTTDGNGDYPNLHTWEGASGNNGSLTATSLCGSVSGSGSQIDATFYDEAGCSVTKTYFIQSPSELTINSLVSSSQLCIGQTTVISASPDGGTIPYTFVWSGDEIITPSAGPHVVGPVVSTDYDVYITDANGCSASTTISVNVEDSITLEVVNVNDSDLCAGSIQPELGCAVEPISYTWSNGSTSEVIDNLCGGTYTVTATDDNGTNYIASATVNNVTGILNKDSESFSIRVIKGSINIKSNHRGRAEVYDIRGRKINEMSLNSGSNRIEMKGAQRGIYLVRLTINNKQNTKKVYYTGN